MPTSEASLYTLTARAPDESTRIELLDGNLRAVAIGQSLGEVNVKLPAGVYAVRFHQGRQFTEKLAMLSPTTPNVSVGLSEAEMPAFATAAPVAQTSTTHEWQSGPARNLSLSAPFPPPPGQKGGSHLLLFLRNPFTQYGMPDSALPTEVSLHDYQGNQIFHLSNGTLNTTEHWAGAHLNLDPGVYRLRRSISGRRPVEQAIVTCNGWQTQIFLLTGKAENEPSYIARCSVLMARAGTGFDFNRPDLRWTESALRALHNKGNIPGVIRTEMLWAKFENPMLGIYAGLLHLRRQKIDPCLLKEVFTHLHQLIGPLPEVLAIGYGLVRNEPSMRNDAQVMDRLKAPEAYANPPMLRESWDHLLKASADDPNLIPENSLADRLGGRVVPNGPWLAWRADLETPLTPPDSPPVAKPSPAANASFFGPGVGGSENLFKKLVSASNAPFPPGATPAPQKLTIPLVPSDRPSLPWDKLGGLFGDFFEQAATFTLPKAIGYLSRLLADNPDARDVIGSPYFNDMERRLACWLQPGLDPNLPPDCENDSFFQEESSHAAAARTENPSLLLTDLALSSSAALKMSWSLFTKLYVKPIIPRQVQLTAYINELTKDDPDTRSNLVALKSKPSPISHRKSGRSISLLECAYLLQWGSPADGPQKNGIDLEKLTHRLNETGYILTAGNRPLTVADLRTLQDEFSPH